jgi:hypothetical protein
MFRTPMNPPSPETHFFTMRSLCLVPRFAAIALALLFACGASLGLAQSVRWEAESGTGSTLLLVFDDCAPDGQPDLPAVPGCNSSTWGNRKTSVSLTSK